MRIFSAIIYPINRTKVIANIHKTLVKTNPANAVRKAPINSRTVCLDLRFFFKKISKLVFNRVYKR